MNLIIITFMGRGSWVVVPSVRKVAGSNPILAAT